MNGRRKTRQLSTEDRILWSQVARSVDPLRGKAPSPSLVDHAEEQPKKNGAPALAKSIAHPPYRPERQKPERRHAAKPLDPPTRRKLARGRISIDATIDLHDMDQREAHGTLLAFLHRAHASGLRHVLVITGKGSSHGSAGVLRRSVPEWLKTAPFRGLVSGTHGAARHHGGEGAIYVRLARGGVGP